MLLFFPKVKKKVLLGNVFDQWSCLPPVALTIQRRASTTTDQMKVTKSQSGAENLRERKKQALEAQVSKYKKSTTCLFIMILKCCRADLEEHKIGV